MRAYYRKKGKYADGRNRLIIEQKNKKGKVIRSLALPKPEELLKILGVEISESSSESPKEKIRIIKNHI